MRKILVIRACAVGDFVLNLPALIALHQRHPDSRYTLVGYPSTMALASRFVPVEAAHSIELQPWSRLFYETLPAEEFDLSIVWMKDSTVAGNLRASGVANVIHADPFPGTGHASDHLLRTLHLARPALPDLWKPSAGPIVIHSGSGSPKKNWPGYDELTERLEKWVALPRNLTLPELSDFLCNCRVFIGNDSGITHLAAFLGCPTIALFGPTDPRIWGPLGRRARILWKSGLADISINEVLETIRRV
jgi:ADP-heptose:LPS heptosyltransferase